MAAKDFADEAMRRSWMRERNLQVFALHDPNNPLREVDLFAESPLPFDDLYARSVVVDLGDVRVRVASIQHLVAMKLAAGRPQDLADVDALRALP